MTAIPRRSAPGTRSASAPDSARSMAESAKSDSARVACSKLSSPDRSPSATARARPSRCRRSSASTSSARLSSAASIASTLPFSPKISTICGNAAAASRRNGENSRTRRRASVLTAVVAGAALAAVRLPMADSSGNLPAYRWLCIDHGYGAPIQGVYGYQHGPQNHPRRYPARPCRNHGGTPASLLAGERRRMRAGFLRPAPAAQLILPEAAARSADGGGPRLRAR
jgi:hypothetical protein